MKRTGKQVLLWLVAGPVVWALCFIVLYGGLSLGCAAGWQDRSLRLALAAGWLLHLAALGLLALRLRRQALAGPLEPEVLRPAAWLLCLASLAGTLWIGWPVLALPACA